MKGNLARAFGKLEKLYANPEVTEIFVDAKDDIYYETKGKILDADFEFDSEQEIIDTIKDIFTAAKKKLDSNENYSDCRLPDGSRVLTTSASISLNGPTFGVVKLPQKLMTWEDLIKWQAVSQDGVNILKKILSKGSNVLVGGNVGSGKNTIQNLLVNDIPEGWRVVALEKVGSLKINRKRYVQLQAEDNKQEGMKDLVHASSMMRADYIVLDELRGNESYPYLDLIRGGNSGITSIHANNVGDALKRVEIKILQGNISLGLREIQDVVSSAINYVVFQERMDTGKRKIKEIARIDGVENGCYKIATLLRYNDDNDSFVMTEEGRKELAE